MTRTRTALAAAAMSLLLALGGASAALAGERPGQGRDATRPAQVRCDLLQAKIAKLQRVQEKLAALVERIEAKIASGELTEEQLARARAVLAKLQDRLAEVEAALARLQEKYAAKCAGDEGADA